MVVQFKPPPPPWNFHSRGSMVDPPTPQDFPVFFFTFFLKPSQIFSIVRLNKSGITFLVYTRLFNNYSTHSFCLTTVQYFITQCIVHSKSPDRNSTSGVELCFVPVEMRPRDLGTNLLRFSHLDLFHVVSYAEHAEMK